MRRIGLSIALLLLGTQLAGAVCPSPITGKDAAGATQNLGTVVDGSGNCNGITTIADGVAAANRAAVKAASTAAAATDPALVVSLSPNSGAPQYQWVSAGAGQYALALTSVQTLTVPSTALIAEICIEGATSRYTTSGTTPSSTVGIPANVGCFQLAGHSILVAFQAIGAGATLDAEYFK